MPLSYLTGEINGNAMTPSSRVTAINLVGDLLRKVGVSSTKAYVIFCTIIIIVVWVSIFETYIAIGVCLS